MYIYKILYIIIYILSVCISLYKTTFISSNFVIYNNAARKIITILIHVLIHIEILYNLILINHKYI